MRLITRANIDGVTSSVLLSLVESVEQIAFTNAKEIEDNNFIIRQGDAIINLPGHKRAVLWFDHHYKSINPSEELMDIKGLRALAPSTARLIYQFYDSPKFERYEDLLNETDRIDSANLSLEDITNPQGWTLIGSTLDPYETTPAYYDYLNTLISAIKTGMSLNDILEMNEVKGRIHRYHLDAEDYQEELKNVTQLVGKIIVTDFREVDLLPYGNRFLAFGLYPQATIQMRIYPWNESKIRIRLGRSMVNRSSNLHLGKFAAEMGGGGLEGASEIIIDEENSAGLISDIVAKLNSAG